MLAVTSQVITNQAVAVGDEPLFVDLPYGPSPQELWICSLASASGRAQSRVPVSLPSLAPLSGIFMVRAGTSVESLAQAQDAAWSYLPDSRGQALPCDMDVCALLDSTFGWAMYARMSPLIIPEGWTLRAVLNCAPGGPAPGPGALSTIRIDAQITRIPIVR
ncbi:MAG: hypothetical protein ACREK1_12200 [Longimicrobiales bacterium]